MSQDKDREEVASAFKVEDRRMFTSEGEPIGTGSGQKAGQSPRRPPEPEGRPRRQEPSSAETNPQESEAVDFSSFVLSLATSAMAYLGEVPDPATGKKVEHLEGAKQMIDILSMLKAKTQGNLEADEERLIASLLYELRMKYLSKARVINL